MDKALPSGAYCHRKGGLFMFRAIWRYLCRRQLLSARMRDLERNGLRSTLGPQR